MEKSERKRSRGWRASSRHQTSGIPLESRGCKVSVGKTSISTAGVDSSRAGMSLGLCSIQPLHLPPQKKDSLAAVHNCVYSALTTAHGPGMPGNAEQVGDLLTQEVRGDERP